MLIIPRGCGRCDAGGTKLVTKPVTYDFIKSWAEKNGVDFDNVCKAINF